MRIALVAVLLLAGCNLGPDYKRPSVDIPPAFRATADSAAQAWPAQEWWRGFNSPELNDLIARARLYNNDLLAAAARVLQADAQVRINSAPLLPSVNANVDPSYERLGSAGTSRGSTRTLVADPNSGQLFSASGGSRYFDTRSYRADLSVSYEADFWGRNRALAESAQATLLSTRFDQEVVAQTVITSVANTYFAALSYQDRLRTAERNLRYAEQILQAYRARLQVGTGTALDVSQQEALVASERATLPGLRNQFQQQAIALGILVGVPPERLAVTGGSLEKVALPSVAPGLPSQLLARRPDVAEAESNLVAQNGNIRSARAAFFPDVVLTASQGVQTAALSALTGPGTLITQLSAAITQVVFDNGLRRGQLDLAKGRYTELLADYRRVVLQAFTDVEQYLTGYNLYGEQEARVREAVAVAQRSVDIANAQLAAGTIDVITSLNTQSTLFNDLDQLYQVRLARFQSLVNLYKALGGGWSLPAEGTR